MVDIAGDVSIKLSRIVNTRKLFEKLSLKKKRN
jgi:hypothetical protein